MPVSDALRPVRPTIVIEGETYPAVSSALLELQIHDSDAGLARCELTVHNWGPRQGAAGFLFFDERVFRWGARLEVRLGDTALFEGRISALEGRFEQGTPPALCVLAEDALEALRRTRRTRIFDNISDAQLLQQLAGDHGLQAEVSVSGPTHVALAQLNETDLAFLRRRAREAGFELWAAAGRLHAAPRSTRRGSPLELTHGASLRSFRVTADLAGQCSRVRVGGWDVSAKEALSGESDSASLTGEGSGRLGARLVEDALGARTDIVAHVFPASSAEADACARAWMAARARGFVRGQGVVETSAELRVGRSVRLGGLGPLFDGDYDIVGLTHRFDGQHGLASDIAVERAWIGAAA